MVVIRLSRGGSKARPFYNIVAADKRVRRVALDRVNYWKGVGAQASETAERLIKQATQKTAA